MPPLPTSWKFTLILSSNLCGRLRVVTMFSHQNLVCISCLLRTCLMPHLSLRPWFDSPSNIWWGVRIMKLLIMYFSSVFWHFCHKHRDISPSCPFSHNSLCTSRNITDRVSHPCNTKGRITVHRIKTAPDIICKLVLIAYVGLWDSQGLERYFSDERLVLLHRKPFWRTLPPPPPLIF